MSNSKPKVTEDEDVVLYMDELPSRSNDLGSGDVEEQHRPLTSTTSTAEAGVRLLETDNVNNPPPIPHSDEHPLHRQHYHPDAEEFDPELHVRGRDLYAAVDAEHHEFDDDPSTMRAPSPRPRLPALEEFVPLPSGHAAASGNGSVISPDMNIYQQKKTIAQGMMDLALISANANQFRYVLQSSGRHPYYYASLAMIGLSLFLQVVVGIGLIWNSRYNVQVHDQMCKANRANNWTVIAIFLVTILNVFISSFGVVETSEIIFASGNAGV